MKKLWLLLFSALFLAFAPISCDSASFLGKGGKKSSAATTDDSAQTQTPGNKNPGNNDNQSRDDHDDDDDDDYDDSNDDHDDDSDDDSDDYDDSDDDSDDDDNDNDDKDDDDDDHDDDHDDFDDDDKKKKKKKKKKKQKKKKKKKKQTKIKKKQHVCIASVRKLLIFYKGRYAGWGITKERAKKLALKRCRNRDRHFIFGLSKCVIRKCEFKRRGRYEGFDVNSIELPQSQVMEDGQVVHEIQDDQVITD